MSRSSAHRQRRQDLLLLRPSDHARVAIELAPVDKKLGIEKEIEADVEAAVAHGTTLRGMLAVLTAVGTSRTTRSATSVFGLWFSLRLP